MRLSVHASKIVLLADGTLVTWPRKGEPEIAPISMKTRITSYREDGILAISPSGKRDRSKQLDADGAIAACAIDEDDVAMIVSAGGRAILRAPKIEAELDALEGEPAAFAEKIGFLARTGEEDDETPKRGVKPNEATTLFANAHGIGVASNETGCAFLFRPGSPQPTLALRFDTAGEDRLYARPTERGLLITALFNGRPCTVFHVGENKKLLGSWQGFGSPPALVVNDRVIAYDDDKKKGVHVFDLAMKPVAHFELPFWPVTSGASADGASFAFANDSTIALGVKKKRGNAFEISDTLDWAALKRQKKRTAEVSGAVASYAPKRAHGAPALGFAVKPIIAPPWKIKVGRFELELIVRSTGGAGKGLSLALSGAALAHVAIEGIELDGTTVKPEKIGEEHVAQFPEAVLPEGVLFPLEPAAKSEVQLEIARQELAATHLRIKVRGTAKTPSRDLLSVAVRPAKGAPMKTAMPLVIEA